MQLFEIGLLVAFITSVLATKIVERVAHHLEAYDQPTQRSAHSVPTPRFGGVAVALSVLLGLSAVSWSTDHFAIVAGGLAVAVVGFIDDVHSLPVAPRYATQFVIALVTASVLAPSLSFDIAGFEIQVSGWAGVLFLTVWLTAVVNMFNFMDGIDGMISIITVAAVLATSAMHDAVAPNALLLVLGASMVGFLCWNYYPASIFLGDSGSYFVGFLLGATLIAGNADGTGNVVPIVILLSPLVLDTAFTLVRRLVSRHNVFEAHDTHVYQTAAKRHGHRATSVTYGLLVLVFGYVATGYGALHDASQLALLALVGLTCLITAWLLVRGGVVDRPPPAGRRRTAP